MAQTASSSAKPLIESDRVEGTDVYGEKGERIGTVKRLMIEKISGRVAYAVIAFGAFRNLHAGDHTIPWGKLRYDTKLGGYLTSITEGDLQKAPHIDSATHDWGSREREEQLHDYYQIPPYWRAI